MMSRFSMIRLIFSPQTHKFSTFQSIQTSSAQKFYSCLKKREPNVEKNLNFIKAKLDGSCVCQVLHRCSIDNSIMGLRFFVWAGLQPSYRHSKYMYNDASEIFKIRQNPNVILDLIECYRVEECSVSVKMMKVVLNLCKEAGLENEALWVLRKMPEMGLQPDTSSYNAVIKLFCQKGDVDTARKLMREMGDVGLYPDMVTFVDMIKGYGDVDKLEDACGLFKEMKEYGCVPNVVVFSALLDGFCRMGYMDRALALLAEMEKEGGDCSPNVITYNSVIQSFCTRGLMRNAVEVLDRMMARGCGPNRGTISIMVEGLCKEGCLEEAYGLINKVIGQGSVSSGDCYSSLVLSLVKLKKLDDAEKLFKKMLACGMKPDGVCCSFLTKELCFNGRFLDGYHLIDKIAKMEYLTTLDSDIYSTLLVGLCQQGHMMEAERVAKLMLDNGIQLRSPYDYDFIGLLKKSGHSELIAQLGNAES